MSQDILPALIGSPLPLVDDKNQDHLSKLGWTPIAFAPPNSGATAAVNTTELCPPQTSPHPLLHASEALLANSQKFFDQSVEEKKKVGKSAQESRREGVYHSADLGGLSRDLAGVGKDVLGLDGEAPRGYAGKH